MADDQKPSSPTVLYRADQTDTQEPETSQGGALDPMGRSWQMAPWQVATEVGEPDDQAGDTNSPGSTPPDTNGRPSGVISLDDEDLKLIDLDTLERMPDQEFYTKVHGWLNALHDSFDYDTTLVPENKLLDVPLVGVGQPQNLETTDKHFSADNDANRVNPRQLYFAEAALMVLAITKAIARRTTHRPDLDSFRGKFAQLGEKAWLSEIANELFEDEYIDEKKFDTNEATLAIKETITQDREVARMVAPYLVSEGDAPEEKSDESDVRVERVTPESLEEKRPEPGTSSDQDGAGEGSAQIELSPEEQELADRVPGFTDLIEPQIPEVVAYLESALRASGTEVPDRETLAAFARAQLQEFDAATLMGIAAGIPLYRERQFSTMSKALLAQYTQKQPTQDDLVREMALSSLRGIIALRLADDATPDEILADFDALSNEALSSLLGLHITAENEVTIRTAVHERATQLLIAIFSAPPTGKKVATNRQKTVATYSAIAPQVAEKNTEIEENVNKAAEGVKTTGQKVQAFLKSYQKSWNMLSQDEQIMVYFLADLPVGDQMFESTVSLDKRLPLPFEFVNFAYATYGKEFQDLLKDFQLNRGKYKGIYKDARLKSQLLSTWSQKKSAIKEVEYLTVFMQQEAQLQLDAYQSLRGQDKEQLARAAGFASAAEYEVKLLQQAQSVPQYYSQGLVEISLLPLEVTSDVVELVIDAAPNPMVDPDFAAAIIAAQEQEELEQLYAEAAAEAAALGETADFGEYQSDIFAGTAAAAVGRPGVIGRGKERLKEMAKERMGQAFKQARQKMVKKATKKVAEQAVKQGVRTAGKAAAGATAGLSMVASEVLTNKKIRDAALALGTAAIGFIVDAAGTLWGMVGGVVGGIAGWFLPVGPLLGAAGGTMLGYGFGQSIGWNPRLFGARQYPLGQSPMEPGMGQLRSGSQSVAGGTGGLGGGDGLPGGQYNPMSLTAGSGFTAGALSASTLTTARSFLTPLLSTALFPVISIGSIFFVTMLVLTVIWGAFLVPTPDEPGKLPSLPGVTPPGQQPENPYVRIRKSASPTNLPNNTETAVTYTIQVEAKTGYSVKINSFTDTFTAVGEKAPQGLTSPTSGSEFGSDIVTTAKEVTYQVSMNGVDALVTNTVEVTFDVYAGNRLDSPVLSNQKAKGGASISIGNPKLGCWPASGDIWQLENGSFSHKGRLDAIDIGAVSGMDWTVYAPIAGEACAINDTRSNAGYGKHVRLKGDWNGAPIELIFGHFSDWIGLTPGSCSQVQPGTPLGIMDSTGFSSGDHLHYELVANSHGLKLRDLIMDKDVRLYKRVNSCFSPK